MEKRITMERKDQKAYSMEDFQFAHETLIGTRHGEVLDAGEKIHKFVLMSNKGLKISKGAQPWKSYVDYIAGIVVEGLSKVEPVRMRLGPRDARSQRHRPIARRRYGGVTVLILVVRGVQERPEAHGRR